MTCKVSDQDGMAGCALPYRLFLSRVGCGKTGSPDMGLIPEQCVETKLPLEEKKEKKNQ